MSDWMTAAHQFRVWWFSPLCFLTVRLSWRWTSGTEKDFWQVAPTKCGITLRRVWVNQYQVSMQLNVIWDHRTEVVSHNPVLLLLKLDFSLLLRLQDPVQVSVVFSVGREKTANVSSKKLWFVWRYFHLSRFNFRTINIYYYVSVNYLTWTLERHSCVTFSSENCLDLLDFELDLPLIEV